MISTTKEFYYDDLVILTDDLSKKCSVGLVTKEKPFTPSFLKSINSKDISNETKQSNEDNKEPDNPEKCASLSPSDSDDGDDSSSEGNLYDPPQKETVNVSWFIHKYNSEMSDLYDNAFIENIAGSNLHLYDRNLEMSDIVKLNNDGKTKVGTVFNVKMRADVCILGQNKIIKNVDCSRMKWIEPYMGKNLETNYTYDSWLGEVLETSLEVIVKFVDGARLKIPESLLNQFDSKINAVWNPDTILEGCVMEGDAQDLKSRKTKFLHETPKHNSKWLIKLKQEEIVQVLVEKIIPITADMQWVFGYNNKNGVVAETPPHTLKGKELEKLEPVHPYPWHCLTVGDIWYYQLDEDDKILQLDPEDSMDKVIYKLIYGDINNCPEYHTNVDQNINEDFNNNKILDIQIQSSGFVVKPRKKILCNIKNKTRRKSYSSNAKNYFSSDDTTDSENNESNVHNSRLKNSKTNINENEDNLKILTKEALSRMKPNNYVAVGILLTKCLVDVNWQDGTINYNIPTIKLIPQTYSIDEHEFFPGDFVVQKFDPLNPNHEQTMHDFGTIISANSKDRVAKVQWFNYVSNENVNGRMVKAGDSEEFGVYDISALNEHHFVLGQEVIIKQEVAHKNYPAGYVTRLEPNDGFLVIRWPDGQEIPVPPTDLLLTVESAIGGGSVSTDENGFDLGDDLSSDLESDSDSTDWETVEESELNQSDQMYQSKLICARKDLQELSQKIKKVEIILSNVTEFIHVLQANLPLHMSQMLSIKDIFKINEESDLSNDNPDITFAEQQMAIRTLFDIRQSIGLIYKQCNDVGIKRMFECYRPKEFLSFRNIKNFIISNVKFQDISKKGCSFGNYVDSTVVSENLPETNVNVQMIPGLPNGSVGFTNLNSEENPQTIVGNYLIEQYKNIRSHLQDLQESIDVWLFEKSCYISTENDEIEDIDKIVQEPPRVNMNGEEKLNNVLEELEAITPNDHNQMFEANPTLNDECRIPNLLDEIKQDVSHAESSDRTLSNCEPIPDEQRGLFSIIEMAPSSHKFFNSSRPSLSNPKFSKAWKRDINLLSTSLPRGVVVKSFEDRVDLFSVMIVGPSGTPYQHALFFFDIQLGAQYPTEPPSVFYISLSSERVNPNLYTEGRVCLSLLGTWNGKGTENWNSKVSSLLQLIVSLQGLILVSEPYYNEAGFEIRKGSEEGKENSQRYNENAINNISQSMVNLLHKPIQVFEHEINEHFREFGNRLVEIHNYWSTLSDENIKSNAENLTLPDFPLAPVSKGFHLSVQRNINNLKKILSEKAAEWD